MIIHTIQQLTDMVSIQEKTFEDILYDEESKRLVILTTPRTGSSYVAKRLSEFDFDITCNGKYILQGPSKHNKYGYFEQVHFSLLLDQLIRMIYGIEYSFLYPPSFELFQEKCLMGDKCLQNTDFSYDINEETLLFIEGEMTEWGLQRMKPGEKWYKCYSKHNVDTYDKIIQSLHTYIDNYEKNPKFIIKDPRLCFVLPFINFKNIQILKIERNPESVLKSMREHYGENMFTNFNTNIVSNHFNYKIKSMPFDKYYNNYTKIIDYLCTLYPFKVIQV